MMHIVMFSINPLFPDKVMGGAPKHLQNIAIHMGNLGHQVSVLATRLHDETPFKWQENVTVHPILRFKQPFPQPYAVPAYDLASIIQDVGDFLATADRFYLHDGELLFPYMYRHIPTIVSLRDNVYPETLVGGFLFNADRLILISDYSRQYFEATVGRFFPGLHERVRVIHNGIDWEKFRPVKPSRILDIIPIDPDAGPIVLHPHRPEESKGIMETIAVADLLVHQHGMHDLRVLAPRWIDAQATPDLKAFYALVADEIQKRGLTDHFILHDWVPQSLMPEYYSLGDVTLSLGHFVESFGNAVYESMGCGTPSVVARISTHRELMPETLIDKVDYGDHEAAAAAAARIIRSQAKPSTAALEYLKTHYGIKRQLHQYADVILEAEIAPDLVYQHKQMDDKTHFRLAPWCYIAQNGVYHDFQARYTVLNGMGTLIAKHNGGFTYHDAAQAGIDRQTVTAFYRDGFLVPQT